MSTFTPKDYQTKTLASVELYFRTCRSIAPLKHILPLLAATVVAAAAQTNSPILSKDWNPRLEADRVMARMLKVTARQVKGAHDAKLAICDGKAFVVAEVNDRSPGESAQWDWIYSTLSVVDIETMRVEKIIPFARSGQAYANETLPKGVCFAPNILQIDDQTLRCFFSSERPDFRQSQVWYIDFDLKQMAFKKTVHRAKIKTAAGTFDMQPKYFHADAAAQGFQHPAQDAGLYLVDSFKTFDGKTYIAINNWIGKQNALAVLNDTFDTFEILGHYNEPEKFQMSESSVNRLPDGKWMAICRKDGDDRNYAFTTSRDGKKWSEAIALDVVKNGTNSKPTFDRFDGIYYLGWQENKKINGVKRSVFNIDVSRDGKTWERKYTFETGKSFQYPTFCEYRRHVYFVVTQGDTSKSRKERIMFGKLF